MSQSLSPEEKLLAQELAEIYYWMDKDCRRVSPIDKERLYSLAAKNSLIHYVARELCSQGYRKKTKSRKQMISMG